MCASSCIALEDDGGVVTPETERIEQRRFDPAFLYGAADSAQGAGRIGFIIVRCRMNLPRMDRQYGRDASDGSCGSQRMADKRLCSAHRNLISPRLEELANR